MREKKTGYGPLMETPAISGTPNVTPISVALEILTASGKANDDASKAEY